MRLGELAVRHRATVFLGMAAVAIAGLTAYSTLPRESFPEVDIPNILVYTLWPGAAPADVERQITDEIERELQGLSGLKELTSSSLESVSVVNVEFSSGVDLDFALQRVRDRVDLAKSRFPADAEEPILRELNLSEMPILQVHLSGDLGPVALRRLAKSLQDEIEALPGVLRATLVGGVEREVQVDVDPERLRHYGLSLDDVIDAIRDENVSIPGGELRLSDRTLALRVPGEVDDPAEIEGFVIQAVGGRPILVRDVASVRYGVKDRESYSRIDGRESVSLAVQKRVGANIIEVTDRVKEEVERLRHGWPQGVEVAFLADMSQDIRIMVSDLENNVLTGVVLVVVILFFALGLRNALIVGAAIPMTMLLTFMVVQLYGYTLNMMVLFALVLAVGMLVDNSIVVIDNIYRHVQEGKSAVEAAVVGSREVGAAVAVSTFTTIGAFFPLFFWPGIVGDFMSILPIALCMALLSSLLVAFTANPTLAAALMRRGAEERSAIGDHGELPEDGSTGSRILARYKALLTWALAHRLLVIAGVLVLFVAVIGLFVAFNHGVELFPETEPRQIFVDLEMPPGTRLEHTDRVIRELERRLGELPDIRVLAGASGAGAAGDEFFGGRSEGGDPTRGRVTLDLLEMEDRSQSSFRTMEQARALTRGFPGAIINVERPPEGPPVGDPLEIEISGEDFAALGGIAERIQREIADIPGLATLDSDFDLARPEVLVRVDRAQAARLGLTTAKIASTLRTAVHGAEASKFRDGEDQWDITVRLEPGARASLADLARLVVVNEEGRQIPLDTIATVETGAALQSIQHKNRRRVVTVSGKVTSPELAHPVREEARRRVEAIPDLLPEGVTIAYAGQSEDEEEAKEFLSQAFLYALFLVLLLIVGKFNSYAVPAIIMTSVLMSMIGVLLGLLVTGTSFGIIMTGVGVISLAGVVVNNAIVLLDYGEQQHQKGLPRRSVVLVTGMRRLRPVVLTAVTTILALTPTVVGFGFDFRSFAFVSAGESSQWWRPMGVAVMFGLAFATLVTLVVVPVLYDLLLELRERRAARHGEGGSVQPRQRAGGRVGAREGALGRDPREADPDAEEERPTRALALEATGD
jgi:multidrug efflux pump